MRSLCTLSCLFATLVLAAASLPSEFIGTSPPRNDERDESNVSAAPTRKEQQAAQMQLITSIPKCGLLCLQAVIEASPCSITDTQCSCSNATMTAQVEQCVLKECHVKEALTTKNISATLCGEPVRDRTYVVTSTGLGPMVIALVCYLLRIASKVHLSCGGGSAYVSDLWWDDALITASVMLMIPFSALTVPIARNGFGKDVWTVPFHSVTTVLKIIFMEELLYLWAMGFVKISLLLTYLRFFSSNTFRKWTYVVMGFNIANMISFTVAILLQCEPLSYTWRRWDDEVEGTCHPFAALVWSAAAINIVLDFAVLGLPIVPLWQMKLNKRKKFLVMLMFSMGFFVTIISILRLHSLVVYNEAANFTWVFVTPGVWTKLEVHGSVICACMPAIRQFVRRFSPRLIGSTGGLSGAEAGTYSTGQSGLSGRTSVWMTTLQSGIHSRAIKLNSPTGTIAVNDVQKSGDREVGVFAVASSEEDQFHPSPGPSSEASRKKSMS